MGRIEAGTKKFVHFKELCCFLYSLVTFFFFVSFSSPPFSFFLSFFLSFFRVYIIFYFLPPSCTHLIFIHPSTFTYISYFSLSYFSKSVFLASSLMCHFFLSSTLSWTLSAGAIEYTAYISAEGQEFYPTSSLDKTLNNLLESLL